MKRIIIVASLVLTATSAWACYSNLDCGIGGTCIKSGHSEGVCSDPYGANVERGGKKYYEDSDRGYTNNSNSIRTPSSGSGEAGKECYSRLDCGIGGDCIKTGSHMNGVCTK
jgi:hypothetical protein